MEKLFISHQSRHSNFDVVILSVIFQNWTLIWRVNNFVSRQQKSIIWRNQCTKHRCCYLSYYNMIQSFSFRLLQIFLTVNRLISLLKNFEY